MHESFVRESDKVHGFLLFAALRLPVLALRFLLWRDGDSVVCERGFSLGERETLSWLLGRRLPI